MDGGSPHQIDSLPSIAPIEPLMHDAAGDNMNIGTRPSSFGTPHRRGGIVSICDASPEDWAPRAGVGSFALGREEAGDQPIHLDAARTEFSRELLGNRCESGVEAVGDAKVQGWVPGR